MVWCDSNKKKSLLNMKINKLKQTNKSESSSELCEKQS